ncbi:hypothetical protein [Isoptericola aurantiacus]|uniref:hypothetical protein n=1 Tax=Isoptericola aurantiacus TaxID=3377839 RepID=UPI00383AC745
MTTALAVVGVPALTASPVDDIVSTALVLGAALLPLVLLPVVVAIGVTLWVLLQMVRRRRDAARGNGTDGEVPAGPRVPPSSPGDR